MKNFIAIFIFAFIFIYSSKIFANNCSSFFPDAVSIADSASTLTLQSTARINNSPDNILDTVLSNFNAGAQCGSGACGVSGSALNPINFTGTISGSSTINIGNRNTIILNPGNYSSVSTGTRSTINVHPGNYNFSSSGTGFSMGSNSEIVITQAGTVRFYVAGDFVLSNVNRINIAGGTRYFILYVEGDVIIDQGAQVNAIIYAKGNIVINGGTIASYTGAITSEGNSSVVENMTVNYDASMVSNADFNGLCDASAVPQLNNWTMTSASNSASACFPTEITITARDSSGDPITDFTGSISLSASPNNGTWSKTTVTSNANGVLSAGASDSGFATYTFDPSDNGQIVLNYAYDRVGDVDLTVSGEGLSAQLSSLNFSDNAFVFVDSSGYNNDVIANRPTTFSAQLWKYDLTASAGNECGVNTNYNVANIKAWVARTSKDAGGAVPTLTNSSNATLTLPEGVPASVNFAANFVNGIATITLNTEDVGHLSLNFMDDSTAFSSGIFAGSTGDLTIRPFGFDITVPNNPGASSHTGGAFKRAGETFSVTVRAVGWDAADDVNDDGMPDNHASDTDPTNNVSLTNNPTLVSFGNENAAERVRLRGFKRIHEPNSTNVLVNSSGSGSASIFSNFTNGVSTKTDVRYGDVGILVLEATILGDEYIDASVAITNKMKSRLGYVGRFYPFEFAISGVALTPACASATPFTYFGQPLALSATIQAKNSFGNVLGNYYGDFAKLTGSEADVSFAVINQADNSNITSRFTVTDTTPIAWSASGGSQAYISWRINETRLLPPQAPLTQLEVGLLPTDSDGVTLTAADLNLDANNDAIDDFASIGLFELRYGRLVLSNAFSSEVVDLPAPFYTEYFDGLSWQLHADDSCTEIPFSDIIYPNGAIDNAANRVVNVGSGQTTGSYAQANTTSVLFSNGQTTHSFSAPGAGNTGSFSTQINLGGQPWLSFDSDGDGNYNELSLKPAVYSFGSYRGHDRVIYWQENLD